MLKRILRAGVCVLLLAMMGPRNARAQTPQPQIDSTPIYTICTLLVGGPVPPAGGDAIVTALSAAKLSAIEAAEFAENIAELQEKLKAAFHLEQLDVVSSYGDWMSPAREMVLEGGGSGLKLVVTSGGVTQYPDSEATVHRGDGTSYVTKRIGRKGAQYTFSLTSSGRILFQKEWSATPGMRTVIARQAESGGPLYFIVLSLPLPGVSMSTTFGMELQGTTVNVVTSERLISGTGGPGKGSGTGVGIGHELRAPKQLYAPQPTLSPDMRAARLKGPVILSGWIAADGGVQNIKVLKSVEGLDEIATAAFRQWRYEAPPLGSDGKPVPIQVTVVFPFRDEPEDDTLP